jgi:hypothetical protein
MAIRFSEQMALKEYKYLVNKMAGVMEYGNFYHKSIFKYYNNLNDFKPTFIESNFNKKFPKKPSRIFVNSMSDIAYWKPKWMERVIERIKEYPQHTFMFLTKTPIDYQGYTFPLNCWLGATATKIDNVWSSGRILPVNLKTFISIEPIQEHIKIKQVLDSNVDWVIVGSETGNRKNKIIPEKSWIEEFRHIDIPVFMKDNLKDIIDGELRQEFPA